jgi:hypothetical protein
MAKEIQTFLNFPLLDALKDGVIGRQRVDS